MSKVKHYIGDKTKARHRLRRYETKHIRERRIKKCKNNTYYWVSGGYWIDDKRPNYQYIRTETGEVRREYKPGTGAEFLRRASTRRAKYYKTQASRYVRHKIDCDEDSYMVLKGNKYRRLYEVVYSIW